MPGLFSRVKNWIRLETVKAADLNAEFDNVITNFVPDKVDDYSASVSQMRTETSPGAAGTESQATTLAGELERIRYVVRRAFGGTYWYDNPNTSLTALKNAIDAGIVFPKNRISTGRIDTNGQPMFLVPDTGSNANVRLKATSTNLQVYINNTLVTVSADLTLSLSGPSAYTLAVNNTNLTGTLSTRQYGEPGFDLAVDTASGSAPTVGTYQAWKIVHSAATEYFYAEFNSTTLLRRGFRGYFFNTSDATIPRLGTSDNDVITLCRAGYIFFTYVASVPALAVTYNQPYVQVDTPSGASSGDWWLDLTTGIWKTYNGSSWNDGSGLMIGIAVVDGSNCVAARSADFGNGFSSVNTIRPDKTDSSTIGNSAINARTNVYGNDIRFRRQNPVWSTVSDFESGTTDVAFQTYYLYLTYYGDTFISEVAPHDRRADLLGYYHPSKPWRCVGTVVNNDSSNFNLPSPMAVVGLGEIEPAAVTRAMLAAIPEITSSASGSYSGTTLADVTNLVTTDILSTGRTMAIRLIPAGAGSANGYLGGQTDTGGGLTVSFLLYASVDSGSYAEVFRTRATVLGGSGAASITVPCGAVYFEHSGLTVGSNYKYKLRAEVTTGSGTNSVFVVGCKLVARELA